MPSQYQESSEADESLAISYVLLPKIPFYTS